MSAPSRVLPQGREMAAPMMMMGPMRISPSAVTCHTIVPRVTPIDALMTDLVDRPALERAVAHLTAVEPSEWNTTLKAA